MYLLFRLLSEVQLISVAINIFFVSLVCHQTLASWKVWRTLELVPPASAANSSGNITPGYHGGFSEQAAPLCLKTDSILNRRVNVPPASAANSSGNITKYQPGTETLDLNVLFVSTILLSSHHQYQILPSAPNNAAKKRRQFIWQYHWTMDTNTYQQTQIPANAASQQALVISPDTNEFWFS